MFPEMLQRHLLHCNPESGLHEALSQSVQYVQMDLQTLAKDYIGPAFDPYDFVKGEQVWNYIRRVNNWRYAIHDMEEPQMANPGGLCQERRGIG